MEDLYTLLEKAESNDDYRTILESLRWPEGFSCPRCGDTKAYRIESRKLMECRQCQAQISATSGTALHGVKNLKLWVKAILSLLEEDGLSSTSLSLLFKLDYATTWFMMQKIRLVLGKHLEDFLGDTREEVSIPCATLKKALFKHSGERRIQYCQNAHDAEKDGGKNNGKNSVEPIDQLVQESTRILIAYLLGTFYGVSRKYSQLYVYENSIRLAAAVIDPLSLITCFVRGSPLPRKAILKYIAPQLLRRSYRLS